MHPPQVAVAIVGAGRMGEIRIEAIQAHPRMKVAYVVDQNIQQAQKLATQYNTVAVQTLQQALADPHVRIQLRMYIAVDYVFLF
jgi:myo-inositol 2-dehydrogenase/D-chiro-inositol 1-dehydrogenase